MRGRRSGSAFGPVLGEVVRRAGVPYGYTLTIWSAGALCIRRFGLPDLPEVFLFLTGGSVGYGLAVFLAHKLAPVRLSTRIEVALPRWENVTVIPALAATYGISQAVPDAYASFLLVPLVATLLYLLGLAWVVAIKSGFWRSSGAASASDRPQPVDPRATGELRSAPQGLTGSSDAVSGR